MQECMTLDSAQQKILPPRAAEVSETACGLQAQQAGQRRLRDCYGGTLGLSSVSNLLSQPVTCRDARRPVLPEFRCGTGVPPAQTAAVAAGGILTGRDAAALLLLAHRVPGWRRWWPARKLGRCRALPGAALLLAEVRRMASTSHHSRDRCYRVRQCLGPGPRRVGLTPPPPPRYLVSTLPDCKQSTRPDAALAGCSMRHLRCARFCLWLRASSSPPTCAGPARKAARRSGRSQRQPACTALPCG